MIKEYVIDLGMNVAKRKISDLQRQHDIRKRLKTFIDRKFRENYNCSREEELDFAGLVEYIIDKFLDDMEMRLFGNRKDRSAAHQIIIAKAIEYSKSKTNLSEKRARKIITDAIEVLREFYRIKANRELLLVAAEIVDDISEEMHEQHNNQTETLLERIDELEAAISENRELISADKGLLLFNSGQLSEIENRFNEFSDILSTRHHLFPNYGFRLTTVDGETRFKSVPLSKEAAKLYPPRIKYDVAIKKIGEQYIDKPPLEAFEYANRHQLPIIVNVINARKYLGDSMDPIQYEAEVAIGKDMIIPPRPFPKALPFSISFEDVVMFDYVLLRVKEILDNDIIVMSNEEQDKCPYRFTLKLHENDHTVDFTLEKVNCSNEEALHYAIAMKQLLTGSKLTIKDLSSGEPFIEGTFNNFKYNSAFDSIDDEIDFLTRIITIEKHYSKFIEIPSEIYQSDWDAIIYLSDLILGKTYEREWQEYTFTFDVSDQLKKAIAETEDKEFSLSFTCVAEVKIWDETYEISIARTFAAGTVVDLDKIKTKVAILDPGDSLKIVFRASDTMNKMIDVFYDKTQ